jgi:ankyrin repeat protein
VLASGADAGAADARGRTPLHEWAGRDVDAAELLLAHGAGVDATCEWLETPLHEAVRHRYAPGIQALLAAGADPDAADWEGRTPLHLAVVLGYHDVVEVLAAAGADTGVRDGAGHTPLDLASGALLSSAPTDVVPSPLVFMVLSELGAPQ